MSAPTVPCAWDDQRRAAALIEQRDRLLRRMPRAIRDAARLTEDLRELIVDESIQFAALDYEDSVGSAEELERVFWDACGKRVHRALEGRYDTVRGGHARADLSALDTLPAAVSVEDEVVRRAESQVVLEFAAQLGPTEQQVWSCRHAAPAARRPAHVTLARRLRLPIGEVRAALATIEHKRERFAAIYAAGRLCGFVAPSVAALAAGDAATHEETAARVHLEHCQACRADYARHLRYLRSARFQAKVAGLLPAPPAAERVRITGLRDILTDWSGRVLGHDPAAAAGQLAAGGAGRGLGTAAAVKLATVCFAGVGAVGACVATGVLPVAQHQSDQTRKPPAAARPAKHQPAAREPRLPHGAATPTPTSTPKPKATPNPVKRRTSQRKSTGATQGGTGPTAHENDTPASPALANAAPNGASEFDPTYQPSGTPQPAPAPSAPGASEFF